MSYTHPIPDAPIALSMLPRAEELTPGDLLLLARPGKPIGQRSRSVELSQLQSSGILSKLDVIPVEFSAATDVEIGNKPYTIILLDNKQNNANTALTLLTPTTQDFRGVVDVVVHWRDQDTNRIQINIGTGTYWLHPQNCEWGRFFIGAEGRCWSYQISVQDHTVGESFSGSGTISEIARTWELGAEGFTFTASINGTDHEVKLSVKNGGCVLEGIDKLEPHKLFCGDLNIQDTQSAPSLRIADSNVSLDTGYDSANAVPYTLGTMATVVNRNTSNSSINVTYYKFGYGTHAPSDYSSITLPAGRFLTLICMGVEKGTDNLWRPVFATHVPALQ